MYVVVTMAGAILSWFSTMNTTMARINVGPTARAILPPAVSPANRSTRPPSAGECHSDDQDQYRRNDVRKVVLDVGHEVRQRRDLERANCGGNGVDEDEPERDGRDQPGWLCAWTHAFDVGAGLAAAESPVETDCRQQLGHDQLDEPSDQVADQQDDEASQQVWMKPIRASRPRWRLWVICTAAIDMATSPPVVRQTRAPAAR
jgi:hypothetical protein